MFLKEDMTIYNLNREIFICPFSYANLCNLATLPFCPDFIKF